MLVISVKTTQEDGCMRVLFIQVGLHGTHACTSSLYFFFFPQVTVAKTSKIMLNKSGESAYPFLVPDLRGKALSFLPSRMMF